MEVTQATLSALRRELHRYPELALEEHHTAQVIERELDNWGHRYSGYADRRKGAGTYRRAPRRHRRTAHARAA